MESGRPVTLCWGQCRVKGDLSSIIIHTHTDEACGRSWSTQSYPCLGCRASKLAAGTQGLSVPCAKDCNKRSCTKVTKSTEAGTYGEAGSASWPQWRHMAAHMSTHRPGEMGKGVYKRGQWITENPVCGSQGKKGTRTPNHADKTQPVQNRKADAPARGRAIREVAWDAAPPPKLVPLG